LRITGRRIFCHGGRRGSATDVGDEWGDGGPDRGYETSQWRKKFKIARYRLPFESAFIWIARRKYTAPGLCPLVGPSPELMLW